MSPTKWTVICGFGAYAACQTGAIGWAIVYVAAAIVSLMP